VWLRLSRGAIPRRVELRAPADVLGHLDDNGRFVDRDAVFLPTRPITRP
jgi:hypothetical protein